MTYSDSDIQAMAQLVMSGTNMQSGYSGLVSSPYSQFRVVQRGLECPPSINMILPHPWAASPGRQPLPRVATPRGTATISACEPRRWQAIFKRQSGTTLFTRVIPVLGAQAANPDTAISALQTPYWSSGPASNYPIKAIAIAPYWGNNPSAGDCTAMTGQSDGGLADFFATLTSQYRFQRLYLYQCTRRRLPRAGRGLDQELCGMMSSYPSMKLIAYEGGQNFYATNFRNLPGLAHVDHRGRA